MASSFMVGLVFVIIISIDSLMVAPNVTKIVFHIDMAINVRMINNSRFIPDIPAGMDSRLPTTGMNLPNKTANFPFLKNHSFDL